MIINDFGMPFNDVGNDRLYAASEWAEYFKNLVGNGVVGETGNELAIIQQTVPNKTVIVSTGAIMVNGYARVIGTPFNLTLADNTSGNPRIDRIIARLNITDRKIEIVVKQGTPASSPSAPTLIQNATTFEISIAKIAVANGFSSIINANITDERTFMTYRDRVVNDRMDDIDADVLALNNSFDSILASIVSAKSLSQKGYIKLAGLVVQWDKITGIATTGTAYTFATPFTSTVFSIVFSGDGQIDKDGSGVSGGTTFGSVTKKRFYRNKGHEWCIVSLLYRYR